jgi:hypothetical protein
MAGYTGTLVISPHRAEDTLRCSASIQGLSVNPITFPPTDIESVVGIDDGAYTYVQQDELKVAFNGVKVNSFLDDYYYRIHLNPASVAFGPIVSPTEETFIVWNAWFVTKACSSMVESHPLEYSLSPTAGAFSLVSLEIKTFTVSVTTDGSLEFDATVTFTFGSETPVETLTGTRVAVFSFVPKFPMRESLEWNTNILAAKDGSEQRFCLRKTPRQYFRFDCKLTTEQEQARLEALMFEWAKRMWGIPVWGELTEHSSTLNINDTTISFDTRYADYRANSYALIWQGINSYEAVKVQTVDADKLNLEKPILSQWTGNKFIMPLRIGYMLHPEMLYNADGFSEFGCGFLIRYNKLITSFLPTGADAYDSAPVLNPSLVGTGLENAINAGMKTSDFGLGDFERFSDSDFNMYIQAHVFRYATKQDIWNFRALLHYLYGRQETCWIISDKKDFDQSQTLGAGESQLTVTSIGMARYMGLNSLRTHIAFVFPDNTRYYRQITGFTESGSEDIVGLSSSLGVEVDAGDCEISFLDKCRMTEEKIDIEWEEPTTINSKISFTKVKA